MRTRFRNPHYACRAALTLGLGLWASTGLAATFAVGSGTGCTHSTVQAALSAAASTSGPHLIKLLAGTIAVPNGLTLHNSLGSVTLEGGYPSCSASTPTAGQRTTLDATGGNDGTVLDIRSNFSRHIRLSRLVITGGTGETGIFASSEGGGLELRGDLDVFLENNTEIRGNRANRAAGVLIEGGPGRVKLWINRGAQIRDNIAETDGGGVWCWNLGFIEMMDSSVSFNEAGRDGGGLWMGNRCRLKVAATTGNISQFNSNVAGTRFSGAGEGRGGAVFYRSSEPFAATGFEIDIGEVSSTAGNTFVLGNRALGGFDFGSAGSGGGAFYLEGRGSQRVAMRIRDAIFVDNSGANSNYGYGIAISLNRAIDLLVEGRPGRCSGTFGIGWCSAFVDHRYLVGSLIEGSLIQVETLDETQPDRQPRLTLRRVRLSDNVLRTLISEGFGGSIGGMRSEVESSLLEGNALTSLQEFESDGAFRFNTVVGNAMRSTHLFEISSIRDSPVSRRLDLRGSILWQPGTSLRRDLISTDRAELIHGNCLLSHTRAQLSLADAVLVSDPQLGTDFMPGPASPALDVCNTFVPGDGRDAFGQLRPVDQPGIPNRLGAHDLGAIERPLSALPPEIFANGFE